MVEELARALFVADWLPADKADERWAEHARLHDTHYRRYIMLAKTAVTFQQQAKN